MIKQESILQLQLICTYNVVARHIYAYVNTMSVQDVGKIEVYTFRDGQIF